MTAIASTDVQWFLSAPSASAGYTASGTPGASLGKWMSTTQVSVTPLDSLFTDLTAPENSALQVDYQCLFMMNMTATGWPMQDVNIWIPEPLVTIGGASMALGLDPTGVVAYNASVQQAVSIANSLTAPVGVAWYPPTLLYGGPQLGNIAPNHGIAVWFQRTATDSIAAVDSFNVAAAFQSNA